MGSLRLRVTIIGGSLIRVLYGTRFKFNRVLWVSGLLLLGLYLFLKWFISQLDPILFLLWAIAFMWVLTVGWVAGLRVGRLGRRQRSPVTLSTVALILIVFRDW